MAISISPIRPIHLVFFALLGLCMNTLSHADTLIFTDRQHPIINADKHPVIYLDAPSHIEAKLSEGLSDDPIEAERQASQRVQNPKMQQELLQSYSLVVRGWQLGIVKVPAVVVDEQYVVYGQNDIQQALKQINHYKESVL